MFKHFLLKYIYIHGLNLLNFVGIVVFDVETSLENAKLAILEGLEFQIFFAPLDLGGWGGGGQIWQIWKFSSGKWSRILEKPKCYLLSIYQSVYPFKLQ